MYFLCSVPELRFIEPQGLTSDHVKELTEEVEKLAKEKVGEVGRERKRERERDQSRRICIIIMYTQVSSFEISAIVSHSVA